MVKAHRKRSDTARLAMKMLRVVSITCSEKYFQSQSTYIQSTIVYVPSSELGLQPTLSPATECAPPPQPKGGHTRRGVKGWGSPNSANSDDWRKSLGLCLLCAFNYQIWRRLLSLLFSFISSMNDGISFFRGTPSPRMWARLHLHYQLGRQS